MLPPYVIGCTARDVTTWQWRYIKLCEREESQSMLPVHVSGNLTYCNCCVQQDGWCCLWVWNASVCIVAALREASHFSHVVCEVDCSLMITSTQMKAEDPLYPGTCAIFVAVLEQRVRFFPLRWYGPTTSK